MAEQLGIDWGKLLVQAFNFLVLLWILQRFAYKPLLRMLDERSKRIRGDLDEARQLRAEAERDRENYRQQLGRARDEARSIMEEANNVSARIREQALIDAEGQNSALLQRARDEIAREKEAALSELRREVAGLVVEAAGRVIGRSLDDADRRRLADEAIAEVQAAR